MSVIFELQWANNGACFLMSEFGDLVELVVPTSTCIDTYDASQLYMPMFETYSW